MLNWRTIGENIEINGQKLLKCSNYSPMLNYMCRRARAYLKQEFILHFIKNIQKKNCLTAEFLIDTYFVIRHR